MRNRELGHLGQPSSADLEIQPTEHDGAEHRPPARHKRSRQSTDDDTLRPPPPPTRNTQSVLPPPPAQHPTAPTPSPLAHDTAEAAMITTSTMADVTPQGSAPHAPPSTHHVHPPEVSTVHCPQPAHAAHHAGSHCTSPQSHEQPLASAAPPSRKRARPQPPRDSTMPIPATATTPHGDGTSDHTILRRQRDPGKASNAEEKRRRT